MKRRIKRTSKVEKRALSRAQKSPIVPKIVLFFRLLAVRAIILLIDSIRRLIIFLRKKGSPALRWLKKPIRKYLLGTILNIYFFLLKLRKRLRGLLSSSRHTLWNVFNAYIYKATIVVIIIITLSINIGSRSLSADELRSKLLLNTVLASETEEVIELIEEGPLNTELVSNSLNYVDSNTVLSEDYIDSTLLPDADNDDQYATTEGDSTIIAPIITNPNALPSTRRDAIITYEVQTGDTISTIAQQFGISTNTLLWENSLTYNSTIRPGDELTILPVNGIKHTVSSGENISAIAKKYQAEVNEIVSQNKLADASDISVGEVLIIPDGIRPSAVTRVPAPAQSLPSAIVDIFTPDKPVDSGTKLLWPLTSQRITQYYHLRHSGLDVGDKLGNPIYAAESGKVERSGWNQGYGYNVVINHGNGLKTLYGHASELLVSAGDTVSRGDEIARIGSTGWSTGPHLHFEVRVNGSRLNPLNYIR